MHLFIETYTMSKVQRPIALWKFMDGIKFTSCTCVYFFFIDTNESLKIAISSYKVVNGEECSSLLICHARVRALWLFPI